ncbi:antitoxin [Monashia sp. NPDC004114]
MSFGDQLKHKADEVHLQEKAKDFGDAIAEMIKAIVSFVAGYAEQNREKVDGALDKAEAKIGEKTGGKHTETVSKVRAGVDKSLDKLVEQQHPKPTVVPDDKHSAFDDESPSGSPS